MSRSPNAPLPSSAYFHCDSRKPPVNHLPGPERAADPGRLGANRRPRPEPVGGSPPDAKLRLTPRRENREATYRPPPSSAHPRLRRRRRSFRAIWSAAARSWRTSDEAERAQAPLPSQTLRADGSARTASRGRRRANASESGCPRRRRRATSIYGTKPSRLWFSAKCRQITPTAHPLSGPIRSELGPKVTGLPRPRC